MNREPDKNPRKALGKGLSALLPTRPGAASVAEAPQRAKLPERYEDFQNIPVDRITVNTEQPRRSFDEEKLSELAQSIRENGLIQPITVFRVEGDRYRLIAGERRWRASQIAGLKEIPALVRTVEQDRLLELALVENIQREDLNAIETATAFQRLSEEHKLSHDQIAQRTGKDRTTITNFIRLLRLAEGVRDQVASGAISMGHAKALLQISDPDSQAEVCEQVLRGGLSVRATEALARERAAFAAAAKKLPHAGEERRIDPNIKAAVDAMQAALGTKVRILPRDDQSGKIEIEYYSHSDLDHIYAVIVKE